MRNNTNNCDKMSTHYKQEINSILCATIGERIVMGSMPGVVLGILVGTVGAVVMDYFMELSMNLFICVQILCTIIFGVASFIWINYDWIINKTKN